MNFVIPMAGKGQRFIDAGFEMPKMLITAHGKTLLEWSIDSLPLELCTNMVCIILQEHETQFSLSKIIQDKYGNRVNLKFYIIDKVTQGQAETVYLAKHLFDRDADLLVFNIDTFFNSKTIEASLQNIVADGVLGAFENDDARFSYAETDVRGFVTKTAEKEVISNHALTGLYHFKQVSDFEEAVEYYMANNIRVKNEFYVAPVYNYLIAKGRKFILDTVETHFILGTPEELSVFMAKEDIEQL